MHLLEMKKFKKNLKLVSLRWKQILKIKKYKSPYNAYIY